MRVQELRLFLDTDSSEYLALVYTLDSQITESNLRQWVNTQNSKLHLFNSDATIDSTTYQRVPFIQFRFNAEINSFEIASRVEPYTTDPTRIRTILTTHAVTLENSTSIDPFFYNATEEFFDRFLRIPNRVITGTSSDTDAGIAYRSDYYYPNPNARHYGYKLILGLYFDDSVVYQTRRYDFLARQASSQFTAFDFYLNYSSINQEVLFPPRLRLFDLVSSTSKNRLKALSLNIDTLSGDSPFNLQLTSQDRFIISFNLSISSEAINESVDTLDQPTSSTPQTSVTETSTLNSTQANTSNLSTIAANILATRIALSQTL